MSPLRRKKYQHREPFKPREIEQLLDLLVYGMSPKWVAHEFDCTHATVLVYRRRYLERVYRRKPRQLEMEL